MDDAVDVSRWPVVVITWPENLTLEQLDELLEVCDRRILARKQLHAIVIDCSNRPDFSARFRERQASWIRERHATITQYNAGHAYVIKSAIGRGIVTALFWVVRPPGEHLVCGEVEAAIRYCEDAIAKRRRSDAEARERRERFEEKLRHGE